MAKIFRTAVLAGGITSLLYASALADDLDHKLVLSKVNQYLSHPYTTDKAICIADIVRDEDLLFKVAMSFAMHGNPTNAVWYAGKLSDKDKQYEVAETVILRGNPSVGRSLLEKMPDEYKTRGIELLIETGNPLNAKYLSNYLSR